MNCAWCGTSTTGSHGICDDCMKQHFGVDPASIHAEIAAEQAAALEEEEQLQALQAVEDRGKKR
ncbi:MAG: hypothetical protein J2P37_00195 [Ktedonobacteraceae bacterium]|nr:hypothetical protein [Ktedonobacteraceae bacterium]